MRFYVMSAALIGVALLPVPAHTTEPSNSSRALSSQASAPEARPPARDWKDNTGRFTTTAVLVRREGRTATLRKTTGEVIEVPIERLSREDQNHLQQLALRSGLFETASRTITEVPRALAKALHGGVALAKSARWQPIPLARRTDKPVLPDVAQERLLPSDLVYIQVSRKAIASAVNRTVTRRTIVGETIVGTPVHGTALASGTTGLQFVPSTNRAVFDLLFYGNVQSQTTGFSGPVRVHSSGMTHFSGAKRVILDEYGIEIMPARVTAQTSTTINGVSTNLPRLRGRIARRIGNRRAMELKPAAEAESGRKAEIRLARQFDEEVAGQILSSHGKLRRLLAVLPRGAQSVQGHVYFATSNDYLQLALHREAGERSAERPPSPQALGGPDLAVHVHSSLVDRVLRNDELRRSLDELAQSVAAEYAQFFVGTPHQSPPLNLKQSAGGQWWSLVVRRGGSAPQGAAAAKVASMSTR